MAHLIVKQLGNGGKNYRWRTIDDVATLRDVWDYYKGGGSAFKEKNIYYQINPCQYSDTKAKKTDVINNTVIPIDIDGLDRTEIEPLEKDILEFFEKIGITDYITINSGNGLHALISTGVLASNWIEKNKKSIVDIIYNPIDSIAKEYGGDIDKKVLESSRILRVPNTLNVKEKKGTSECKIITDRWIGDGNKNIVNTITKTTQTKVMEQHNVSFHEVVGAFEEIGGKWIHQSSSSYLEHPERGSKKTLTLYKNAKYFYSFSDKDEYPFIQMSDVWHMFQSGKPFPFSQFDEKNIYKIVEDIMGYDFRYAITGVNQHVIVAAVKDKSGYTTPVNLTKPTFTTNFKTSRVIEYLEKRGVRPISADEAFVQIIKSLPVKMYDAEPIDSEKNKIMSKWIGIGSMRFDSPAKELDTRISKTNLINIINNRDEETLSELLITIDDDKGKVKCCLSYQSLRAMFGKQSDYFAESEMEFKNIIQWFNLETSKTGGLLCLYEKDKISFVEKKKLS